MKRKLLLVLISFAALILGVGQPNAQMLFHADFENSDGANNIDEWTRTTEVLDLVVEDGILKQSANDSVNATKVLVPVDGSGWTDYTVAVDLWFRDNDILGFIFRYTDEDSYYSCLLGASDFGNSVRLAVDSALEQVDGAGFNDAAATLLREMVGPFDQSGGTGYTIAATVTGDEITVFFEEQVDVLDGEMPPEIDTVTDGSFSEGTAGIYVNSCPSDFDNFIVLGPAGKAVSPKGKLACVWGALRAAND